MSDQWDTKYPVQNDQWETLYGKAMLQVQSENSAWRSAFASILVAEQEGQLRHLKRFHRETIRKHDVWVWRWGLWDLHCRPIFEKPLEEWPQYARDVREAVPEQWLRDAGSLVGLPAPWDVPQGPHQNPDGWRTVWAFKTTVLLIAGRIERKIRPSRSERNLPIETLVPAAVGLPGLGDMKPLIDTLVKETVQSSVECEMRRWRREMALERAAREDGDLDPA